MRATPERSDPGISEKYEPKPNTMSPTPVGARISPKDTLASEKDSSGTNSSPALAATLQHLAGLQRRYTVVAQTISLASEAKNVIISNSKLNYHASVHIFGALTTVRGVSGTGAGSMPMDGIGCVRG